MRRALVALGCVAGGAIVTAVACSFPDPDFVPDGELADTGSVFDGLAVGDATPADGGDASSADACAKPCDCDDDGDLAKACNGGDCDDRDPRVRSDAGFSGAPPGPRGGDWNCDEKIEMEFDAGATCALPMAADQDAAFYNRTCSARSGFSAPRASLTCGDSDAGFAACKWNGVTIEGAACIQDVSQPAKRVVGCR